jgi:hypothetical protein
VDAAPEGLRGLGRAPRLADDTPSSSGRRVRPRALPATADLLGLPKPLHGMIAARMDSGSRAMLAGSHPVMRDSLRAFSVTDKAAVQGWHVDSLEAFRDALQDVRSLPPEPPDLQARPLAGLAGRIGARELDDEIRGPAFDDILATIRRMPTTRRGLMDVPLMTLAAQVEMLQPAEQPSAFQRLLLAQEPPGSQADVLHLLAGRMEDLPEAARRQAFTQVLPRAVRLEPSLPEGVAAALVGPLPDLPPAAQWPAFSGLLQQCSSLASEQRAVMLKALTHEIELLSEPVWLPAVRGVLAAAEPLAPEQRWAVLGPLCQEVRRLPEAEQSSTWRAVVRSFLAVPPGQLATALVAMAHQINTLRDDLHLPAVPVVPALLRESLAWLQRGEDLPPAPRATILLMLARGLRYPPLAERQDIFRLALQSIPLLEQEHRSVVLTEWANAIKDLPEADRQPVWQATLEVVEQLPPQRVVPLAALVTQMAELPAGARAAAFESVLQANSTLPAQTPYQELSVTMLGSGCLALPRAQWPHALDRVLEELARLPEPLRRVNVLALATKFCQAEPATNGPIDPGQLDNPGLDLRLQCLDKVLGLMPPPPHPLVGFLEFLNTQMTQRLQQRPDDDAAFLTEVLKRIHRLMGA